MAVANTFIFGGVDTSDYGLVVEGSGDYSAPKRAVEVVEVPGRNGAFQLDKGYYKNIEIEYRVVVKDSTQADFRDSIDAFRNAIVSQLGYQRLEDTYHPGEYRMAAYAGGLDEDPAFHGNGAIFKVKFDCKPQRYLTSGESAIEVESGDTITNPTLFESSPLLEVEGYGNIGIGGETITIQNEVVGHIDLAGIPKKQYNVTGGQTYTHLYTFDSSMFAAGDIISIAQINLTAWLSANRIDYTTKASESGTDFSFFTLSGLPYSYTGYATVGYYFYDMTFAVGTAKTYTRTTTYNVLYYNSIPTEQITITMSVVYDGADTITLSFVVPPNGTNCYIRYWYINEYNTQRDNISGESTKSALGDPMYIDLDLGEAWNEDSGTPVSVNNVVTIPAILPTLAPGATEITFDNTVTDLKVIPRWWKI